MKKIPLLLIILQSYLCIAQIDAGSLLGLPTASLTEMNAITAPNEGSLLYNTTTQTIFFRNATVWRTLTPIEDITTSDPFLSISNTNNVYTITTSFKNMTDELIFEDEDYCYVSMVEDGSNYLVIRYDKTDVNVEESATGTGAQPSTLAQVQGLTYN
ncbi:hypothetical protein ACFSTE_02975 [Aquimarina hainanensis]|uniref:Uncharacterized protein n=1 Tax=Aquimarina hainanensis TaxID=1578017 RepID=A0ABW5N2D7_9FLAO|nr:hypothetical protein [Aquimarina sp. TRL1]QKX05822.1 hypothetical protein HN014_13200 [Aquimarina sp. TRL1]